MRETMPYTMPQASAAGLVLADLPSPPPGRSGWPWTEASPSLPPGMPNGKPWPRLSIVTPSYNQGSFLEETIRSVLLQGYPNLEYIIMDGGSTDASIDIIHRYAPWLAYVHIGPDGGQAAAIRAGFRHATGEILAWINSDDRYLIQAFARVGEFFARHPKVGFANGDVNYVDVAHQTIYRQYAIRPSHVLLANLSQHGIHQPGCFWRRDAYEGVGGLDPSLQFSMDRDLFIRLTRRYASRRIPGPPLAEFRQHEAAKTARLDDVRQRDGDQLRAKYGHTLLLRYPRLLRLYQSVWLLPTRVRAKLYRAFNLEW